MTTLEFRNLLSCPGFKINVKPEQNNQLSLTDPTQACPVKRVYECLINGTPIDLKESQNIFNSLSVDNLSSIEKRHTDKFDVFNESKAIAKRFSKVATIEVEPARDNN